MPKHRPMLIDPAAVGGRRHCAQETPKQAGGQAECGNGECRNSHCVLGRAICAGDRAGFSPNLLHVLCEERTQLQANAYDAFSPLDIRMEAQATLHAPRCSRKCRYQGHQTPARGRDSAQPPRGHAWFNNEGGPTHALQAPAGGQRAMFPSPAAAMTERPSAAPPKSWMASPDRICERRTRRASGRRTAWCDPRHLRGRSRARQEIEG